MLSERVSRGDGKTSDLIVSLSFASLMIIISRERVFNMLGEFYVEEVRT